MEADLKCTVSKGHFSFPLYHSLAPFLSLELLPFPFGWSTTISTDIAVSNIHSFQKFYTGRREHIHQQVEYSDNESTPLILIIRLMNMLSAFP